MSRSVIISYPAASGAGSPNTVEGKFLQLRWDEREYLVFASFDLHRYHNQILAHFAADLGISHRWLDGVTLEVDAPELKVVGGGRFRLDDDRLVLSGESQVYGRFDSEGLEQRIGDAGHAWSSSLVEIY